MKSTGKFSVDAAPPPEMGSTVRSTTAKPPLTSVVTTPSLPVTNAPFSLDGFLANFSGVAATATRDSSEDPQHRGSSHQGDSSVYTPFVSQQGDGDMFDFFSSAAASGTPCVSGSANGANNTSAGPLVADNNNGGDKGGRLNFDFASLFFQGGEDGAYHHNGLRSAESGGEGGGADASCTECYIRRDSGDMAEGATEGVPPTMRFFFPDDGVAPSMTDGSFVSLPASWSVESAAGTENRYAAPPQPQRLEAVREAVTESVGDEATHTVARSGATLTVVASGPTRIAPVDRTPVKSVPCKNASSSAMEHECSLAEALAAAPSSLGLLSDEESQRTAAPLSRFSDAEETKPDDMPARLVVDHSYPQPEMFDSNIARGVAEVEAMVTLTHSRQPSQRVPPASLPHSSHLPDGAPAAAVVPATPSLPRKPPTPLTPPPSVPCRPEAPLPIRMPGSDATSVALRKAIEEAEEVWTHGLDTECISNPEGRSAETGMSSISTTSSSSSDAVFFAEVTQLQQQAARLTEDSARSAASLQALTSGLLRILGPHAALSSLVGEQYSKTPLVHLSWFLIAVLEGLLNSNADADDEGGAALKQIEVAEKQPAAPRPCSDAAEIGSSGGHAV